MKIRLFILIMLSAFTFTKAQVSVDISLLKAEVEANLTGNILPFWIEHTIDPAGGFYGTVRNDGSAVADADKGSILNARILWTFSKAYGLYGNESYRLAADRAADYVINHFIDAKYGGVFWLLDNEGGMKDGTKQTYATAFTIYGLAEHFRVTGQQKSLETALALYRTLETKVHDKQKQGYIETFERDYTRTQAKGVDGMVGATKTMNTHIHLLEAYTTLYQVWPDKGLKENLKELLGILGSRLYDAQRGHLILYADDDWHSLEEVDSFGHDIETSWLMSEAAAAVGEEALKKKVDAQAVRMVDVAIAEGLHPDGVMLYERNEKGYRKNLSWWPQCETIIGCVNAWQITGDAKYLRIARRNWDYVKTHFVDNVHGGWYKGLTEEGKPTDEPKVSMWNCPYHNSRMAYELIARLEPARVHTEVMAWSNITGVRLAGELIDFESTLRIGVIGDNMEVTGREKQQKIKYNREKNKQITITPMHGAEITQAVTDVDQSTVNLSWKVTALESLKEGVYFCMALSPKYYADAQIKTSGNKVSIIAPERHITLQFSRSVRTVVRNEGDDKVLYVTLMPSLKKGTQTSLSAVMKVDGVRHHETVHLVMDRTQPGRQFIGFGGNFRIQNVRKDPEVIDYCLQNMRVAFGRVEMPWAQWDQQGAEGEHIRRSAEMAKKLKQIGMPVIVSCWFPPAWAGNQTTRSDGTARAYALKASEKERIYASLASYLEFLKRDYGVEADYFSFNESDLGIDVVFTPEEHCTFIKEFGAFLAGKGLKTLMLLGDNSDATTYDFILPALHDPIARNYIGAVSFHSWRGCDDDTLRKWAAASKEINVPLIVGEGSTDAAAHQYPAIFNETTFALYEINLYVRICAISQPWSILQWQLTSDYSILWGDGIYGSDGPLRPTQRFFNLRQLAMTPADSFAVPVTCDKDQVNVAAFSKKATGECALQIVNNGASCQAEITGLPAEAGQAWVYVTNDRQHGDAQCLKVKDGKAWMDMPADSFVTVIVK